MSQRIPRLEMAEFDPRIAEMLKPRVERLKYLGEFFKCTAHVPDVLYHFSQMTEALKEALPDRLTEVVALTVACTMDNAYELHQHERLSVRLGFGEDWVRAVERCAPDADASPMADIERVTAAAFGQRRKMLRTALKTATENPIALLEQAGIAPTARAETLSVEAFCALARGLREAGGGGRD